MTGRRAAAEFVIIIVDYHKSLRLKDEEAGIGSAEIERPLQLQSYMDCEFLLFFTPVTVPLATPIQKSRRASRAFCRIFFSDHAEERAAKEPVWLITTGRPPQA